MSVFGIGTDIIEIERFQHEKERFMARCFTEQERAYLNGRHLEHVAGFFAAKEAVAKAEKEKYGIVLLSASRDYGLDDIIFGPKERHLIQKSTVPVLLVNPRGDLYALCD